MSPLREVGCF